MRIIPLTDANELRFENPYISILYYDLISLFIEAFVKKKKIFAWYKSRPTPIILQTCTYMYISVYLIICTSCKIAVWTVVFRAQRREASSRCTIIVCNYWLAWGQLQNHLNTRGKLLPPLSLLLFGVSFPCPSVPLSPSVPPPLVARELPTPVVSFLTPHPVTS